MRFDGLRFVPCSFYPSGMPTARRFPLPWKIVEHPAAFCIEDAGGTKLAYCYFLGREPLSHDADRLTRDEALTIARNLVRLPDLLRDRGDGAS